MDETLNEGLEPSSAEEQNKDILSMSDDDLLNMSFPEFEEFEEAPADEEIPTNEDATEEELEDDEEQFELSEDPDDTEETEEAFEDEVLEEDPESTEEDEEVDSSGTDYKAKYEELLAPFKGNGKEIKVDTPEDLRRLAQMGVGYNARMAEIKPLRKIGKMLENAGLLEESKVNFLIDLSKNNPDAINKLIKDSGINPLDIDTEGTDGYKPNTYTVDDKQLELDEALSDLKHSPSAQQVIDVVSNKWDEQSRRVLIENPSVIKDLDSHMQNGIYDKVQPVVERERMLGRIPNGMSDLQAYNIIGDQMNAAGAFNQPATTSTATTTTSKPADTKRKSRRRAAASPRSKPATQSKVPSNVLDMSDEDFEKQLMSKYM